jgi:16S rRNA (cytosine1402-N4)-methyltransferase
MTEPKELSHAPVLLNEILEACPSGEKLRFLDCTAGGGGHFFAVQQARDIEQAECWDRDPLAKKRIADSALRNKISRPYVFKEKRFSEGPGGETYDFILADLGISSFQIDDPARGLSLFSAQPVDFRMNPSEGLDFSGWLQKCSEEELERILRIYGEEPKARKLARALKEKAPPLQNAAQFADWVAKELSYPPPSRRHPATRTFQALRIAINEELAELESLLRWAPEALKIGGRLAIISFHSLEDRMVKRRFRELSDSGFFESKSKRPLEPSEEEIQLNSRSRSARLRVLEKLSEDQI